MDSNIIAALVSLGYLGSRGLAKMKQEAPKSGWKTTEFWVWVITTISTMIQSYAGGQP